MNFKTVLQFKVQFIININENLSFRIDMAWQTNFLNICNPMNPVWLLRESLTQNTRLFARCLPPAVSSDAFAVSLWNARSRKHCFHCSLFSSQASGCARRQNCLVRQKYNAFYLLFVWQLQKMESTAKPKWRSCSVRGCGGERGSGGTGREPPKAYCSVTCDLRCP